MAKRRKAGITKVPDRTLGVPLGREARAAVESLRAYGADPDCVPPLDDAEARKEWLKARQLHARNVPHWVLDLAAAVLEQIQERVDRPRGRRRASETEQVEFWSHGGSKAEGALLVATLEARKVEHRTGKAVSEDEIKASAEKLARRVYRKPRKP